MNFYWYFGGIAAGAVVGWVAARCHLGGFAPVGLVSLGVGLALGYLVSKLTTATAVGGLRPILSGAVLFAMVAVFVEHTWLYHDFRRQWQAARAASPQVALFRPAEPWSPAEYLRREVSTARMTLWCVDAALIVTGAAGGVLFARRGANTDNLVVAADAKFPRLPTPHP